MLRRLAILYLLALCMAAWGYAAGRYQVFPYAIVQSIIDEMAVYFEGEAADLSLTQAIVGLAKEKTVARTGPLLIEDPFADNRSGFTFAPDAHDDGYLLFSGLDAGTGRHVVDLVRLHDTRRLHRWELRYDELFSGVPRDGGSYKLPTRERARMQHPLLLDDGSLVFNLQEGPLVRIDACSRKLWVNPGHFHHAIERGADGDLWVSSVEYDDGSEGPELAFRDAKPRKVRDDTIARVSIDGEVLETWSIRRILEDNGHSGLLYGTRRFEFDLLHNNDVTPAHTDGEYWLKGDLLLSIRHLSAIVLFRPSTGRVQWIKVGPWLNQHDPDFVGSNTVSVFSNELVRGAGVPDENRVAKLYLYHLEDGSISTPYAEAFTELDIYTPTEGRARVLDDGTLFVEESNRGRLFRVAPDGQVWSFVNRQDEDYIGMVSWSRYLHAREVKTAKQALEGWVCE